MKKVFNFTALLFIISIVLVGCGNKETNSGNPAVSEFCKAMDKALTELKQCKSIEDFEAIDANALDLAYNSKISNSDKLIPLTKDDKTKIEKALNDFFDLTLDKTCEFSGGLVSKSDVKEVRDEVKEAISQLVQASNNMQELEDNMAALF